MCMKKLLKKSMIYALMFSFFLQTSIVVAQPIPTRETTRPLAGNLDHIRSTSVPFQSSIVANKIKDLKIVDNEIKELDKNLVQQGFTALSGTENYHGIKQTFTEQNRTLIHEMYIQDYQKANSTDKAALVQISINGIGRSDIYSCYLIAPGGDFQQIKEYTVDNELSVVPAHSWWSCVRGKLAAATATCAASLLACSGTLSAYLLCVAAACGTAYGSASACCACNCKWYCKWAIGCCRQ
jgi:hypothetical protein